MGTKPTARIGLELHAQLNTRSKMFCGCAVETGAGPNQRICPVCTGQPGILPVPNETAIRLAVRTALVLDATINRTSRFDRKHYLYPDLPKGYQITQQQTPLCTGGSIPLLNGGSVPLSRVHLEEDAGRSRHTTDETRVDFNRCGIPLMEIVTEPVLNNGHQARETVQALRSLLRYLNVCGGDMSQAQLRCDVNISLDDPVNGQHGIRVEIKNLNSLRHIQRAVDTEIERQRCLLKNRKPVIPETRLYDEQTDETRPMRTKEAIPDYRYMSEPDIPPIQLSTAFIRHAYWSDELPHERITRWIKNWSLQPDEAVQLAEDPDLADFVERAVCTAGCPQPVCRWIRTDLIHLELSTGQPVSNSDLTPETLGRLAELTNNGTISERTARDLMEEIWTTGDDPDMLITTRDLKQISDISVLNTILTNVLTANPDRVQQYRDGNRKILGFLMGQVMKQTNGRADPSRSRERLQELLDE